MKKLILALTILAGWPLVSFAGSLCVRNNSGLELSWNLRTDANGNFAQLNSSHAPGQEWECLDVAAKAKFRLEISSIEHINDTLSCQFTVAENQWIEVTRGANNQIECKHLSPQGPLPDGRMAKAGEGARLAILGTVKMGEPVIGAEIRVLDPQGQIVFQKERATNRQGYFRFEGKSRDWVGYRVEARGGRLAGKEFNGTLSGRINRSYNFQDQLIHVNPVTTLVLAYAHKNSGHGFAEAEARVRHYLNLGQRVGLTSEIELPGLSFFNPQAMLAAAANEGGWDVFVDRSVGEMMASPQAQRPFTSPKMLKGAGTWVAEKIVNGMLEKIGSQIFSNFLDGIGYKDKTTEVYNLLREVQREIAELKRAIEELKIQVTQGNYDKRASDLLKDWGQIQNIIDGMETYRIIAAGNTKDGVTVIEHEVRRQVQAKFLEFKAEVYARAEKFYVDVHSELVPDAAAGATPLQAAFAIAASEKGPFIRPSYYVQVDQQLNYFKNRQALAVALLADAKRADEKTVVAKEDLKSVERMVKEESRILPSALPFTNATASELIEKGDAFYQKTGQRLWLTSYEDVGDCDKWLKVMRPVPPRGSVKYASASDIRSLVSESGESSGNFLKVIKTIGFKEAEADKVKMINYACTRLSPVANGWELSWFGFDRGPDVSYHDYWAQYSRVKNQFKEPAGYWMMSYKEL